MNVLRLACIADGANEGSLREDRSRLTGLCLEYVLESFSSRLKLSHFKRGHSTTTLTVGRQVPCLAAYLNAQERGE